MIASAACAWAWSTLSHCSRLAPNWPSPLSPLIHSFTPCRLAEEAGAFGAGGGELVEGGSARGNSPPPSAGETASASTEPCSAAKAAARARVRTDDFPAGRQTIKHRHIHIVSIGMDGK
eukprot:scaffold79909_cov47-Prasinocladus_malaysianus.AAC.1